MILILTLRIFLTALSGADGPQRTAAIDSLVVLGDVERIGQAVYKGGWRERNGLIDVLEKIGLQAVPVLVDVARNHPKVDGQRLAIRSLGYIGAVARDSLQSLVKLQHRDLVAEALGRVGDKRDVAVVRALLFDAHYDVRRRAALAFLNLAGDEAAQDLAMLLADAHHGVRFAAAEALVTLGDSGGQATLAYYEHLPVMGRFLALGVFGRLRYAPAQDLMKRALFSDDWSLRSSAVRALVVFDDARSVLEALADKEKHPVVQTHIQQVLSD